MQVGRGGHEQRPTNIDIARLADPHRLVHRGTRLERTGIQTSMRYPLANTHICWEQQQFHGQLLASPRRRPGYSGFPTLQRVTLGDSPTLLADCLLQSCERTQTTSADETLASYRSINSGAQIFRASQSGIPGGQSALIMRALLSSNKAQPGSDFRGSDFRGSDFRGSDFRGSDFRSTAVKTGPVDTPTDHRVRVMASLPFSPRYPASSVRGMVLW